LTQASTTIAEYFTAGGNKTNYTRSHIAMGTLASFRCLDPTLALAYTAAPNPLLLPRLHVTMPDYPAFRDNPTEPPHSHAYAFYTASCEPCLPLTSQAPPFPAAYLNAAITRLHLHTRRPYFLRRPIHHHTPPLLPPHHQLPSHLPPHHHTKPPPSPPQHLTHRPPITPVSANSPCPYRRQPRRHLHQTAVRENSRWIPRHLNGLGSC